MIRTSLCLAAAIPLATAALADSHLSEMAAIGEGNFRLCASCHVVVDDEGNTLAGRKAKSGPNLYGVVGSQAGSVEGFRYGKSLIAAGEAGLVWDIEQLTAYLQDPRTYLQTYLDDSRARSKMSFKMRADRKNDLDAEGAAAAMAAYLKEIGPLVEMPGEEGTEDTSTDS